MIAEAFVRQVAVKWQTTDLNVWREYLQHQFLANFYRNEAAAAIHFKGGTALRIIHRSPRFSEDLDFNLLSGGANWAGGIIGDNFVGFGES